ncbi:hypothetical protein Hden_1245 [Hyphomicrobium denitrificans ATCC 51888]|uniref:Uncharacterized protein n=1 Tax=Hyphomicrobium denitrificans (strain ATCC 51888 / DSM 1869 / NCIMB 11706 / TK 0415) TaxID=582899 RepID=D8JWE4_HYPDA|nr:hypothetical protein [Hyphomicrobium denitrificans]ADJ23057.1 hypothetical protein Hden_1245 [Hyphomicrobium denitrificans ATCC 51888]
MNRFPPRHIDELPPDYPGRWSTGSALEIGILLGSIRNELGRQSEISLGMLDEIRDLPERLATKIKSEEPRQVPMLEIGTKVFEFIKEAAPLLAVPLAALAKYLGFDLGFLGH